MGKMVFEITPTPSLQAVRMELRPSGFNPHTGPSYVVTFYGRNGSPVATEPWKMKKEDWQAWPAYDTPQDDEDYVLSRAVFDLALLLDLDDEIETKTT